MVEFRLRTNWLWVRISLLLLKLQIWRLLRARSSLTLRQTIKCRFPMKLVCEMIITYSLMRRTDKYSQHSLLNWPVWLNGWVFVYELSGSGFEFHYCHTSLIHSINLATTFVNKNIFKTCICNNLWKLIYKNCFLQHIEIA